jgi:succinate-acetate transporter protein
MQANKPNHWAIIGWFLVWMAVLSLVFLVCALRTNVVFVIIFAALVGVFGSLSGAFFLLAGSFTRNTAVAGTFVTVSGLPGNGEIKSITS